MSAEKPIVRMLHASQLGNRVCIFVCCTTGCTGSVNKLRVRACTCGRKTQVWCYVDPSDNYCYVCICGCRCCCTGRRRRCCCGCCCCCSRRCCCCVVVVATAFACVVVVVDVFMLLCSPLFVDSIAEQHQSRTAHKHMKNQNNCILQYVFCKAEHGECCVCHCIVFVLF